MAKLKLSAKQAERFIKQLGADVELVADDQAIADKDLSFDEAITAVDASRSAIIKPNIEAEIRESLTSSLAGKFGGDLRAHLRRLSGNVLKTADLKDMKDEEAIQKFMETVVGQKDSSLDDIRNQMKTQLAEWETEKQSLISTKEKEYADLKNKYTERDIDSLIHDELNTIPITGGDKRVLASLAKAYVRDKYHTHYDESKKGIELRDLTNKEKIALNGQVAVQLKDVLQDFAKNTGILKTDMRDTDPSKVQQQSENGQKHDTTVMGGRTDYDADYSAFGKMME